VYDALISVVMPFRDAGATIDAALAGLLTDADPALEVLCVDDGSTDSGTACVRTWITRDPRVRLIEGPCAGLVAALQRGVAHARGTWLARMDADDISLPGRLAAQRAFLATHADVAAVGTRVEAFADDGELGEGMRLYVAWQNSLLTPLDHRRELFVESPLCHPSTMLRRSSFEAVGGYRASAGPEDYDLFLRFDAHGAGLAKLPEVLLRWRHRTGRATFADARYSLARMREVKAPYLAERVAQCEKPRRVLWGAGPTGRRIARDLAHHGLSFSLFVDIDPNKLGRTARGVPIVSMDALDARTDVVVAAVGARGARALIRPALTALGFREGQDFWFAA
jgi:glycosyltransferase involved in cell wall biosynthesis